MHQDDPRPWFEDFFHGLATELWRRAASPEQTAAEAAFLVDELRLRAGSRVLDVPCGFGRHALALAADPGCAVDGVDISAEYVAEAQAAAAAHGGPGRVHVQRGDMRALPPGGPYDAVCCLGNSFGYGDHDDSRAFLSGVAAALRPGGRFTLDTSTAAESLLPSLHEHSEHRFGDLAMRIENTYDATASRLDSAMTFERAGTVQRATASHYVHTVAELLRMLRAAGLTPLATYGGAERAPYAVGSPRLLVVAERADA
jgi:cyclopropane fatty-acyl-phospholipid synthase-like methyltransferase